MATLTKNFNFSLRRDYQKKKKFLWASHLWVGRWKEPIFGYVPKNNEKKKNLGGLRLKYLKKDGIRKLWVINSCFWSDARQIIIDILKSLWSIQVFAQRLDHLNNYYFNYLFTFTMAFLIQYGLIPGRISQKI